MGFKDNQSKNPQRPKKIAWIYLNRVNHPIERGVEVKMKCCVLKCPNTKKREICIDYLGKDIKIQLCEKCANEISKKECNKFFKLREGENNGKE